MGNSAAGKLVWDGFTFTSIGQTIQRKISGVTFDITWEGTGSQVIRLERAAGASGGPSETLDVVIYVPCD